MRNNSSGTAQAPVALRRGLAWGALGVLAFSLSLPTTQTATRQLGPVFATSGRAVAAACLAALYLAHRRARPPGVEALPGLLVVAGGVVVGFPLFTALALRSTDSAHSAVIVGLLPAATAVLGVLRTGERPSAPFWGACGAGAVAVGVFAVARGSGLPGSADGLTALAVVSAAAGYAEGARLAPLLGPDQVICWALLLSLPLLLPVLVLDVLRTTPAADASGWSSFAYTAAVSMLLGFFAWYRGLALGGVAKVSQVQLAQPLLTVAASVVLFGQRLDPPVIAAALAVLLCVAAAQRTRVAAPTSAPHAPARPGAEAAPPHDRPSRPREPVHPPDAAERQQAAPQQTGSPG